VTKKRKNVFLHICYIAVCASVRSRSVFETTEGIELVFDMALFYFSSQISCDLLFSLPGSFYALTL